MKCGIMTLTPGGMATACKIATYYPEAKIYTLPKYQGLLKSLYKGNEADYHKNCQELVPDMKTLLASTFHQMDLWIMIMATGIVVRTCGPLVVDKTTDPAVLVVDEKGEYVISLLSGHLGGANEQANDLSRQLGATPVITTASDVVGVTAMDMLAQKWACHMTDMTAVKEASAALVAGEHWSYIEKQLENPASHMLLLKDLVIGIGCKRGKTKQELKAAILLLLEKAGVPLERVESLATVNLKADEVGLLELVAEQRWHLQCFTPELLQTVVNKFSVSEFVNKMAGVGNVHQTAGCIGSGNGLDLQCTLKMAGITLSLWQRKPMKPAFLLAGTHSGVGKTTVTMGILAAFSKKYQVQAYKVGPDYIDPSYHSRITNQPCINLDTFLTSETTLPYLYKKRATESDLNIIEGVMGLFDGKGIEGKGSSAEMAKLLKLPVVLIVDGSGIANSIAALVSGYARFDPALKVEGVIINRVKSQKHYELLKEMIVHHTGIPCFGYLTQASNVSLPSRHLGLVPSQECAELDTLTNQLAEMVEATIDLEGLYQLAKMTNAPLALAKRQQMAPYSNLSATDESMMTEKVRIAVALDEAFHFYYEDNLELLAKCGAQLVFFSPLHDKELPDNCQGIYIGGGFPEVFAKQLSSNLSMRKQLKIELSEGLPCYAECGGYMYLCQTITDLEGQIFEMVGWFEQDIQMTKSLKHFGYKTLTFQQDTVLGKKGDQVNVHEFHHSEVIERNVGDLKIQETSGQPVSWAYELERNGQVRGAGVQKGQVLGGYPHIHFYGNPQLATRFIQTCRIYGTERKQ